MAIYLDHNATTPMDSRVLAAMQPYLEGPYGNPSSLHRAGRAARDGIDAAREQVAKLAGAQASQVVFTSGGTEADNLAIKGVAAAREGAIVIGEFEHPAILESARALAKEGREVIEISAMANGLVDVEQLHQSVAGKQLALISLMAANNETGVLQPTQQVMQLAHDQGALFHSDAVQAAGKLPLAFKDDGMDLLSLSSHKIYGPKGVGALVMTRNVPMEPLLHGGGHENGMRSGTENVAAIVGFGMAAELALAEREARSAHCLQLRQALEAGLDQIAGVVIFAQESERLPNTTQFRLPGYDGETLLMALDRQGIAVSSGSACSSGKAEPSHVLMAMGIDHSDASGAIRVSFGKDNSAEDVQALIAALQGLVGGSLGAVTNFAAMQR